MVCPWGTNSLWTIPLALKKTMSMVFTFILLILAFSGMYHSGRWGFVSGSYSNVYISSLIMTISKKIGFILNAFQKFSRNCHSVVFVVISQQFGQFGDHLSIQFPHVKIVVNDVMHSGFRNIQNVFLCENIFRFIFKRMNWK